MASYHFSAQIIGRKSGRSAVAAAAYRAGARLIDSRRGQVCDFTRRRGVAHTEILVPEGAADWLADRERLWNHVEAIERRTDAQLAREINMALPHELTAAERLELVRGFVREQFVSRGMVADIAIHEPVTEKGDDPRNFHAHVLLTLRQGEAHGLRRVKTREWNADTLLTAWRTAWEVHQNRALERAGHRAAVDHRTLRAQRVAAVLRGDAVAAAALDRTPEVHIGPQARKAHTHERVAASRVRPQATARPAQGRWTSARDPVRRRRAVNYPALDQGSRVDWNAAIVERNRRRTYGLADKFERQAARLRQREMRAQRLLAGGGPSRSPQKPGGAPLERRQALARKHVGQVRGLLAAIERILAELFHIRDLRGRRSRDLLRVRVQGLDGGRGRSRD